MKAISGIGQYKEREKNSVLAIGIFDGVHLGHQALLKKTVARAKKLKGEARVLTFFPHPAHVLRPQNSLPYIISLEHRLRLLEQLGIAQCIVVRFTKEFSRLSPEQFIKWYIVERIKPREVFIGNDFRFGKGREGTIEYLKSVGRKHGIKVTGISLKGGRTKIGSSRIREYILSGKLALAQGQLGRPVAIMGVVRRGDRRGTRLGFPTANIYPQGIVLPPLGVYAVYANVEGRRYKGMANLGMRPSFKTSRNTVVLEVHIFDLKKKLYGKRIIVELIRKIREEKTFDSKEKLILQLQKDQIKAQFFLK